MCFATGEMVGTRKKKLMEGNKKHKSSSSLSVLEDETDHNDKNTINAQDVITTVQDESTASFGRGTRRRQVSKKMQEWMDDRQQKSERSKRGATEISPEKANRSCKKPKLSSPSSAINSTTGDVTSIRDVPIMGSDDAISQLNDQSHAVCTFTAPLSDMPAMNQLKEADPTQQLIVTTVGSSSDGLVDAEADIDCDLPSRQNLLENEDDPAGSLVFSAAPNTEAQVAVQALDYGEADVATVYSFSGEVEGNSQHSEVIEQMIIDSSAHSLPQMYVSQPETLEDLPATQPKHVEEIPTHIGISVQSDIEYENPPASSDTHIEMTEQNGIDYESAPTAPVTHIEMSEQSAIDTHIEMTEQNGIDYESAHTAPVTHTEMSEQSAIECEIAPAPLDTRIDLPKESGIGYESVPVPSDLSEQSAIEYDSAPAPPDTHIDLPEQGGVRYDSAPAPPDIREELASSLMTTKVDNEESEQLSGTIKISQPLIAQTHSANDSEEVGILLSNSDSVTQALLESFMEANSRPPISTSMTSAEPELNTRHHSITPNIKLTEHTQVDASGRKQTVVYLSTVVPDINGLAASTALTSSLASTASTASATLPGIVATNPSITQAHATTWLTPSPTLESQPRAETSSSQVSSDGSRPDERKKKLFSKQNICTISDNGEIKQQEVILEVYVNSPPPPPSSENAPVTSGDLGGLHAEYEYTYSETSSGGAEEGRQANPGGTADHPPHFLAPYSCPECPYKSDKRSNLVKHSKKHYDRPHACPYPDCSYSAKNFGNLKRHELSHTDERRFPCRECDLRFKQKIHLDKHVNYMHREKSVQCELCDYKCANRIPDLKLHMKRRHLKSEPDDPPTYLECEKCGFLAGSRKDLKQHFKFHKRGPELKLFCEHCSFVTDAKSRLERHRMIHTREKPFSCGLCDYTASQKEHIKRHYRTRHSDTEIIDASQQLIFQQTISTSSASSQDGGLVSYSIDSMCEEPSSAPAVEIIALDESEVAPPREGAETPPGQEELLDGNSSAAAGLVQADDIATGQQQTVPIPDHVSRGTEGEEEPGKTDVEIPQSCEGPKKTDSSPVETVVVVGGESCVSTKEMPIRVDIEKMPTRPVAKYSPPDYSEKPKSFACTHCTMKFVRLLSLYKHLHTQHSDLLPDTEEERLTCVVCDFRAQSHKTLLKHMRRHNTQDSLDEQEVPGMLYVCVLCKYMNSKRRNLYQHLKKKHKLSIIVKKDGTASCVVEPNAEVTVVASSQGQQVTQVVADVSYTGDSANKVVDIVDLANSLTQRHDLSNLIQRVSVADAKTEQDAAEAIVDLATQNVVQEEEVSLPTAVLESDASGQGQLQISAQQLHSLTSGDYIEINGETYMVEVQGDAMTAVLCETPALIDDTSANLITAAVEAPADTKSSVSNDDSQKAHVIIANEDASHASTLTACDMEAPPSIQ